MNETSGRPALKGIHHLKLVVRDLERSRTFYERVFGATVVPGIKLLDDSGEHTAAYSMDVPGFGGAMLEIRQHFAQALQQRAFDPIALAVADRAALRDWITYLDKLGVSHSPVLTGVLTWLIVLEDPDGNRIRIHTLEHHGQEIRPERGNDWLRL